MKYIAIDRKNKTQTAEHVTVKGGRSVSGLARDQADCRLSGAWSTQIAKRDSRETKRTVNYRVRGAYR